jgi:DNA-binding LytR/AlgR family response regulator
MKSLEGKLPAALFQRIHRSHIVNITHVDEVGESSVMLGGTTLVLSKSFRKELLARILSV